MSDTTVVSTTFENREDALQLAKLLLQKRLIACAQISGPVESLYWWKGNIDQSKEYTLLMKSRASLWQELEESIRLNHPYEVPEIIATPLTAVSSDYEQWLLAELQP